MPWKNRRKELGFKVYGSRSGFGVQGLGFGVQGLGSRATRRIRVLSGTFSFFWTIEGC